MPRYIDAELIETAIKEYTYRYIDDEVVYNDLVDIVADIKDIIKSTTTADVAEVKHGKWIAADEYMTDECSMCGTHIQIEDFEECSYNPKCGIVKLNYCPHCGAKMGGKE